MKSWDLFKTALFRFDAEKIHELSVKSMQRLGQFDPRTLQSIAGMASEEKRRERSVEFLGHELYSPVGLAAGFDKNALLVPYLRHMGFSSVEVGSVTLRSQPGNPKPRLFRAPEQLFNRMGFNNDGAEVIARRLESYPREKDFVVGVNLGLNKESAHSVAPQEYAESFRILYDYGDYFVVNVSSPNTPGLRDLQSVENIEKIFSAMKTYGAEKKIFLKLAPELDASTKDLFFSRAEQMGIDGFVLTNTLKGERDGQVGGWSGKSLSEISRTALADARTKTKLPLISVGGIMDVEEALRRVELGATMLQIYTGWIFRGPRFPEEIRRAWAAL